MLTESLLIPKKEGRRERDRLMWQNLAKKTRTLSRLPFCAHPSFLLSRNFLGTKLLSTHARLMLGLTKNPVPHRSFPHAVSSPSVLFPTNDVKIVYSTDCIRASEDPASQGTEGQGAQTLRKQGPAAEFVLATRGRFERGAIRRARGERPPQRKRRAEWEPRTAARWREQPPRGRVRRRAQRRVRRGERLLPITLCSLPSLFSAVEVDFLGSNRSIVTHKANEFNLPTYRSCLPRYLKQREYLCRHLRSLMSFITQQKAPFFVPHFFLSSKGPNNDLESLIGFRDTGKSSYYITVKFSLLPSSSLFHFTVSDFGPFPISPVDFFAWLFARVSGPSKTYDLTADITEIILNAFLNEVTENEVCSNVDIETVEYKEQCIP